MPSDRLWRLGLLGRGIGHSLSPQIHGEFLRRCGLHGSYVALDAPDWPAAAAWLRAVERGQLDGLNVTTPYKVAVAQALGLSQPTVNTVWRADGQLREASTDGVGLLRALAMPVAGKQVAVLGTGGAAASCVPALVQAGARVLVCGRNEAAARERAGQGGGEPVRWGDGEPLSHADIVVHMTLFGHGKTGACQDGDGWQWLPWPQWTRRQAVILDAVYAASGQTWFEQLAARQQVRVVAGGGKAMLRAQAAESFRLWTGRAVG